MKPLRSCKKKMPRLKSCKEVKICYLKSLLRDTKQSKVCKSSSKQKILIIWHKLLRWKNRLGGYKPSVITKLINQTISLPLNCRMIFRKSNLKMRRSINHHPCSNQFSSNLHQSLKDRWMLQLETETRFMQKEHFSIPVVFNPSNSLTSSKKRIRGYNPKYGLLSLKRSTNCTRP